MASPFSSSSAKSALPDRNASFRPPAPVASTAPSGTFLPGTKVQVGSHRVTIEKYLSEGGFAHVYVVRVPREHNKHELAVLKRVAVPDKSHLANMRTEVETMKKLTGHKHVVTYMDSHASQLKGGGYEVFLLMEYCSGGGLIDFMNTRLQHRLTEPEILKIFGDVAEGVACMHYLKPPLLHRDLKVENVLISSSSNTGSPIYKICDFGSTAPPRPAATTPEEGRLIEEDVQQHTTMQYRSPEMIDVWRKQPIDEKSDIWALGVLLYKLCYYTTPFEDVGQMAILNASFKYPNHPSFSEKIKRLIGLMLKEDPRQRPTIYEVIEEVCRLRGTEVPIKDIYASRTQSEARRNQSLPSTSPAVGLQKQAPSAQVQKLPDITPMRRGRPTVPVQQAPVAAKPTPSPAGGDPFALLDSKNYETRAGAVDELSKRFPTVDQFSIIHDKGNTFDFSNTSSNISTNDIANKADARAAEKLADEVFSQSKAQSDVHRSHSAVQLQRPKTTVGLQSSTSKFPPPSSSTHAPAPHRPGVTYRDTAVGSSPPTVAVKPRFPEISKRPIWKVPDTTRSSSQPRALDSVQMPTSPSQSGLSPPERPEHGIHRSKSQTAQHMVASATASLVSSDGPQGYDDTGDGSLARAKSVQSRQRPSTSYVTSHLTYLKDQESARKRPSMEGRRLSRTPSHNAEVANEEIVIADDLDYFQGSESNELPPRDSSTNKGSGHKARASLSNARQILAGRHFKRLDNKGVEEGRTNMTIVAPGYTDEDDQPVLLSPIPGSEAAHSKHSDADSAIDEVEDLPPDVRRELERRRLSEEEHRVAEAAADYRARVAGDGSGGNVSSTRASTIQKRVQSLLDEGRQSPTPPKRTAEGYGRYTEGAENLSHAPELASWSSSSTAVPSSAVRKPIAGADAPGPPLAMPLSREQVTEPASTAPPAASMASASSSRVVARPSVPPKSQALRTGGSGKPNWPPGNPSAAAEKDLPPKPSSGLAALLAKDLEGVPDYPPRGSSKSDAIGAGVIMRSGDRPGSRPLKGAGQVEDGNDDVKDFSKRYPSLAGIEMVETEIGGQRRALRMRDV